MQAGYRWHGYTVSVLWPVEARLTIRTALTGSKLIQNPIRMLSDLEQLTLD